MRDVDLLERIIAYVLANVGTTFSASSLVKFFRNEKRTVATETILNYLRFCADAFLLFQVTYLLASPETIDREFRVCDTIRDNFPKYVVSLDEFDMSRDGIKHLNIREFLLKPEWN